MTKLRVSVIGAGAAGLCAARYLTEKQDVFEFVVYERAGQVGGTWVYAEETENDPYGHPVHSSMYQNLRTNLPKEVMAFPDFPFKDSLPSYMKHDDVLQYLEDYAHKFNLLEHIKFCTSVERVTPQKIDGKNQWLVEVKQLGDHPRDSSSIFDAVIVCNGNFSEPREPDIPGLDTFHGRYAHSHKYRSPDIYKDQIVAVIGAGPSGIDIALDLAQSAKKVFLCHRLPRIVGRLPSNIEQTTAVTRIEHGNEVVMEDGSEHRVDAIIACTGYEYNFPFLSPECQLTIWNHRIHELYIHMIHVKYPTMSFIGVPNRICPFPQFSLQARFIVGVLAGDIALPTQAEMEAEEKRELLEFLGNGGREKEFQTLGKRQWSYNRMLSHRGNTEGVPPVFEGIYAAIHEYRRTRVMDYKNVNFRINGPDSWETDDEGATT